MKIILGLWLGLALSHALRYTISPWTYESKPEYMIELVNQNKVTVLSVDHNRTWTTTPDSIVYDLELDNL